MVDDDDAVARQVHVELDAVGAEREAVGERGQRVLRRERASAAMREHQRAANDDEKARCRHCYRIDRMPAIHTLGDLRRSGYRSRPVKQEIRDNLVCKLRSGDALFPGIIGYDETVIPQLVNAMLSRHNFILLGLRGQAKSRILRGLTDLLDERDPGRARLRNSRRSAGAALRRVPRPRRARRATTCRSRGSSATRGYVEKLATPDVTIADMVGDIDPIKAAQGGLDLADELTMHYGLLPRANRGIFAINELPDLAGKIQVGLFNILQEGDVQIKGYPIRLPARRDAGLHGESGRLHRARQDHHAAQGSHRLRNPDALSGNAPQRAGDHRAGSLDRSAGRDRIEIPSYVREVVEEVAFQARADRKIDKRSGVSQRLPITTLELVVSNAERRALVNGEGIAVPRVTDVYAALPSITGKFELEYEGELRGAEQVARDLIRAAVGTVFTGVFDGVDTRTVVEWFDLGGTLQLVRRHVGRRCRHADEECAGSAGAGGTRGTAVRCVGAHSSRPRSTSSSKVCTRRRRSAAAKSAGYAAAEAAPRRPARREEQSIDEEIRIPGSKKKYYN